MANYNAKPQEKYKWTKGNAPKTPGRRKIPASEKRAKDSCRDALVIVALSTREQVDKLWPNPTFGQMMATKLATRGGIHGNVQAIKEFYDRLMGKVPQAITGEGGKPLIPPGQQDPLDKFKEAVLVQMLHGLEEVTKDAEPDK